MFAKKLLALALATSLLMSMCSCGANKTVDNEKTNKPGVSENKGDASTEEAIAPENMVGNINKIYTDVEGILTFRGNNHRSGPSYGTVNMKKIELKQIWKNFAPTRGVGISGVDWGGGAGWTGQPAIVKWPKETRDIMNIKKKFKKDGFVEVIQASLNGRIYFFDLKTGEPSREPIDLIDTVKGSVSVDPRGYPLLYLGQGIKNSDENGFYVINLINQEPLFFQDGDDPNAPKVWPNFDSSAVFDKENDVMFVGGENGLVYKLKLNTKFDPANAEISIDPEISTYDTSKDKLTKKANLGVENSLILHEDKLYFGDNGGTIRCIDTDLKLQWSFKSLDDIDASLVMDIEDGKPYVYAGCQVDIQGAKGKARLVKLDAATGEKMWKRDFKCESRFGASPSNGGFLATPVVGKHSIADRLIISLCRYKGFDKGAMLALDKKTGKTIWERPLSTYVWSSGVDIYNKEGKAYIFQNLIWPGKTAIIDADNGEVLLDQVIDTKFEASPAIYNNYAVFAGRSGNFYCYKIK